MIQNMEDYYKETRNVKNIVDSFDISMSTKANKADLIEINLKLRDIARVVDFDDFKSLVNRNIEKLSDKTDQCHAMTKTIKEQMPKEVNVAVRVATSKVT